MNTGLKAFGNRRGSPALLAALAAALAATSFPCAGAALFLVSPVAFDFGDVSVGAASAEQIVTITNVSAAAQAVNMAGGGAGQFGGVQNCQGVSLAPGGSCQIFYAFSPSALGAATGSTSLSVNGQAASFSFMGNGVDAFRVSPLAFDFGSVAVGATSADQTVTITNVSNTPQTVNMAGGGAGQFGGVQNCQGVTLAPGASCQVFYAFTPTADGPATGSTNLSVNGQNVSFAFEGNGGAGSDPFLVSPLSFDFGDVSLGATSPEQIVTITNVSGVPQTVNMAGGGAGQFGGVQNCQGVTLAPGESCQVFYAFTPIALGAAAGSTNLSVNGQNVSFSFQGGGVDAFLISPIGFDFGEIALGTTSPEQIVEILNLSGAPQTVDMAGGGAGLFGGVQNCQGITLAPDDSCQIFYAFTPAALGPVTGTTNLSVNGQLAEFSFLGIGVGPQAAVPEPGTLALLGLGLGLAGIACARRRRA